MKNQVLVSALLLTVVQASAAPSSRAGKAQPPQAATQAITTANSALIPAPGAPLLPAGILRQEYALSDTGRKLLALGDLVDAENDFRQALSIDNLNAEAISGLAQVLEQEGKSSEAIPLYRFLLYPKQGWGTSLEQDHSLRMHFALLLAGDGQWPEAVHVYEATIGNVKMGASYPVLNVHFNPNDARPKELEAMAHVALGIEQSLKGKYSEANQEYTQAQRLQPDSGLVNYYLGLNLRAMGQFPQAKKAFEKASQLGSDDVKTAAQSELNSGYWGSLGTPSN